MNALHWWCFVFVFLVCFWFWFLLCHNVQTERLSSNNFPLGPGLWVIFLLCGFSHKVSISPEQTHWGQASPTLLSHTVLLPYMYTWSGYVNFDMLVSISPIFTMGFIRPWLVFRANLEVKRKTPLAVCKPTLRVPLLGNAYLQGSCLFC